MIAPKKRQQGVFSFDALAEDYGEALTSLTYEIQQEMDELENCTVVHQTFLSIPNKERFIFAALITLEWDAK